MSDPLARIHMQVMWNRLISVVEEQAQALLRTAFGSVAREAGDLSAGVYDTRGRMLAQAVTGTPGHVNSMAMAVGHFLERFPLEEMREGDVLVTNDPWMGTGHLFDYVVVTPTFRQGRIVALFACTTHVIDVGGRGFTAEARSVFEEGLYIPHLRLAREGRMDETLLALVRANTREPVQVVGDLLSLVSCNETGCRRLLAMMDEFGLDSIDDLADHIVDGSRAAMLARIAELPAGSWTARMTIDGYERPVELVAELTTSAEGIAVDYEGSSPASAYGINSPLCYTQAYTSFGVKCLVAPEVPNNAGSLSTVRVTAPEGTVVNPLFPAPVTARHVIGQMLPDVVFGCLENVLEGGVPAESAGSIWIVFVSSAHFAGVAPESLAGTSRFQAMGVSVGGMGARPTKDGLSATAFPSGVRTVPVEVIEDQCPLVFWRRELRPESGGPGRFRGGHGSVVEIANTEPAPFAISAATFDRMQFAPRGRAGGRDGARARLRLASGEELVGKKLHLVPAGDRVILELPGGGGLGPPGERARDPVATELRAGLIREAYARAVYGYEGEA
jgi:N-methylhydantoinase B